MGVMGLFLGGERADRSAYELLTVKNLAQG